MKQWLLSAIVVVLLAISAYFTVPMSWTYFTAVQGKLHGAGAAQWQLQFLLAPFSSLLALASLGIAWFVRKPVDTPLKIMSVLAAVVPLALFVLVVILHAY